MGGSGSHRPWCGRPWHKLVSSLEVGVGVGGDTARASDPSTQKI